MSNVRKGFRSHQRSRNTIELIPKRIRISVSIVRKGLHTITTSKVTLELIPYRTDDFHHLTEEYLVIPATSFHDLKKVKNQNKNENINEKRLFPKFQLIPVFRLQVMHDYVH